MRLTFDGPIARWPEVWSVAALLLRGRPVRLALPLELQDDVARAAGERAMADVLDAGLGLDVMPTIDGDRTVSTRTAARVQAGLLPVLATLPSAVGVFLACTPPPHALQAALSVTAGGAWAAAMRLAGFVSGVPATVWSARQGQRDLRELARDLRPRQTVAAQPPPLLPLDSPLSAAALHWLFGCPDGDHDDGPLFGPAAALCLAPLVTADRATQHRVFSLWAARHREKSHAIALGPTAPPAGLPPTATYRAATHLQQDLTAVRALGFSDVTVMGIDGLVFDEAGEVRSDVDAWFAAIWHAPVTVAQQAA